MCIHVCAKAQKLKIARTSSSQKYFAFRQYSPSARWALVLRSDATCTEKMPCSHKIEPQVNCMGLFEQHMCMHACYHAHTHHNPATRCNLWCLLHPDWESHACKHCTASKWILNQQLWLASLQLWPWCFPTFQHHSWEVWWFAWCIQCLPPIWPQVCLGAGNSTVSLHWHSKIHNHQLQKHALLRLWWSQEWVVSRQHDLELQQGHSFSVDEKNVRDLFVTSGHHEFFSFAWAWGLGGKVRRVDWQHPSQRC